MLRRTKVIKIMHNLCFSFLPAIKAVPREIENNAYANFFLGGGGGGGIRRSLYTNKSTKSENVVPTPGIEPGPCVSESGDDALNQVGVVSSGRQNKRTLCHLSECC